MRSIETEGVEAACMSIFDSERYARQLIVDDKQVDMLVDVFSTDTCKFMILKQKHKVKMNLASFIDKYYENQAGHLSGLRRLEFACSTLGSVCAALARF